NLPEQALVPLPGAGLSVVMGAQIGDFTGQSLFDAFNSDWTVDQRADRMGVRLLGPTLRCARSAMISEGVPLGAIQVPADGQPIILLNDRQTIGGYPRLGALTPLAVAQLAQCMPGTVLRLKPVALERAQREQRRLLASWQRTTTE
ncbi:MAG TPA: allophanate hydrolase, partial [Pseudomonas sp.]|nr:allophanate hydrolase [Pseudomonas sp.]